MSPEQQVVNTLRVSQQRTKAGERAVNGRGVLTGPAKAFEGLRRHKFDQQIGGAVRGSKKCTISTPWFDQMHIELLKRYCSVRRTRTS